MTEISPSEIDRSTIDLTNWDVGPANRWTYKNFAKILPVSPIKKSDKVFPKAIEKPQDLTNVSFIKKDGKQGFLKSHLQDSYTDGFLVLHQGNLISELYFDEMKSNSLHLSQSVCKSVVGILAGILIQLGYLEENKQVSDYIPATGVSGYSSATIRNLLDMRTAILFEEDYANPSREYKLMDQCAGWKNKTYSDAPTSYHEFLLSLRREGNHGGNFNYRSVDTDVLGWVCEAATGEDLANLISKYIWQKMGAEYEAALAISPEGASIANGGLNASLRDYAKFGQMILDKGQYNGQNIIDEGWINQSLDGDQHAFKAGYPFYNDEFPNAAYSNQWWVLDPEKKIHAAIGIHGQFIYIDHIKRVVIVKLSTWPTAANEALEFDDLRMMKAVTLHLDS